MEGDNRRVLVVAAHPDDETLGCGGTLLRHRIEGDELYWLILTCATPPRWEPELAKVKRDEIEAVARAYRAQYNHWGYQTTNLINAHRHALVESLANYIRSINPQIIYIPHYGDVHSDHRVTFEACISAIKPMYAIADGVEMLLSYETPSSTDQGAAFSRAFSPNVFVNVTDYIKRKLEILRMYRSEKQILNLPRALSAVRALARHRGATFNMGYAEAFKLLWSRR